MIVSNNEELEGLMRAGRAVAAARDAMLAAVRPGITTLELDQIGERTLHGYGAFSGPRTMYNFPGGTCVSLNSCVAHGIPGMTLIREGDIVNVDVSAELDGFYSDTGATIVAGTKVGAHRNFSEHDQYADKLKVLAASERSLFAAIAKARAGSKMSEIGRAVLREAQKDGFTVIKNLTGHGIGRKLHEEPGHIFSYPDPKERRLLKKGYVLAIEPFVSTAAQYIHESDDGWGLLVPDQSIVAQFEHTIVVTENEAIILTLSDHEHVKSL
jgi:methionyl aminopeptidase